MPDIWMDVDAALTEVPVNILPLTDDTDFKTRETGIVYNQAGMDLIWYFVTTAGATSQTAVTPTTGGDYDWAHQADGMYTIEIPASGGASINNDTEGTGWFIGYATGVLPWRGPTIGFRAAALNNALIDGGDNLDVNVAQWLGTAAATPTVAGVPEVDLTHLGGVAQSATDLKDFADDGYDPSTDKVQGVVLVDTTTANSDMRGTDSAALASVLGALTDAASDGDPTATDTAMQYIKQLINVLVGSDGVVAFPAGATPANGVSLAEAIRATHTMAVSSAAWGSINSGIVFRGTVTAAVAGVSFTCGGLAGQGAGAFVDATTPWYAYCFRDAGGAAAAPQGETQQVTGYTSATGLFTTNAFTQAIAVGDDMIIMSGRIASIPDIKTRVELALPNAAADAAGGLPVSDAGGLDLDTLLNELAAANIPTDIDTLTTRLTAARAGYIDALNGHTAQTGDSFARIGAAGASLTDLGGMSTTMKGQVNAETLDVVNTDTFAEPGQEAPGATVSLATKIGYLYKAFRNKIVQDATTLKLYDDAGTTVDQKATISDDGTDYTRGEIGTGP